MSSLMKYSDNLNKQLQAPEIDPRLLTIANMYMQGEDLENIALSTGLTADKVSWYLDRPEIKSYVTNSLMTTGYLDIRKRVSLINQVIEKKIEDALESGVYSKKDLLDWLNLLGDIENTMKPKEKGPSVAVQINNYDRLMEDLMK